MSKNDEQLQNNVYKLKVYNVKQEELVKRFKETGQDFLVEFEDNCLEIYKLLNDLSNLIKLE